MSAGPSLYRRHRPRTFADVVGQEHVVRTLRNALEGGKVHHAYLFVGSRGTGKTSMAKMLAACLNCERGPTTEPCGVCASCVSIANATSLDVVEMDAASNNSVDDIRALRDAVAYAPVTGRTKVYILDEAHMLSTQAWNAFLKTLEEPPPSTIFVLATTEASKVLPTVVDRCHRFDFHRPTVEQLQTVLSRVAGQEDYDIGAEAIALIARHATGSFRDALGTLEQLTTYSGATIATEDVLAVLGVADADLLFGALDAIAAGDARGALHAAAAIAGTGRDLLQACQDLEAHARSLMVVQTLGGDVPSQLRVTPDLDARLAEQARAVPAPSVVRLLDLLAAAMRSMKDGADPRTQLELALVKAAAPEVDPSARALQTRLERLEAALSARTAATPVPPQTVAAQARATGDTRSTTIGPPVSATATPPVAAAPAGAHAERSATAAPPAPAPLPPSPTPVSTPAAAAPERSAAAEPPAPAPSSPSPAPASAPAAVAPERSAVAPEPPAFAPAPAAPSPPPPPAQQPVPVADPAAVATAAPPALAHDLAAVLAVWPAVLETTCEQNSMVGTALEEGRPVDVRAGELVVAFPPGQAFQRRMCEAASHKELIGEALRTHAGGGWRVTFETREALAPTEADLAPPTEDEIIDRLQSAFDAEEVLPDDEEPTA